MFAGGQRAGRLLHRDPRNTPVTITGSATRAKALEIVRRDDLVARSRDAGEMLRLGLTDAAARRRRPPARAAGGVEIVRDRRSRAPCPARFVYARRVAVRCQAAMV